MLYCQAILPRAGLANRLFPWARCRIFSYVNNIPMLSPRWTQIKIGPLLRRESDLRFYHDLFKKRPEDIGRMKRLWLLSVAKKEPEPDDFDFPQKRTTSKHIIVAFKGERDHFRKLNGWNQFLYKEIRAMTRDQWLKEADKILNIPSIGIHVRRGDFAEPESDKDFYTKGLLKTPLLWFIKSLWVIREILGFSAKAFVVSDGMEKELEGLLNLENVIFVRSGSAISDLLVLSKAKILIGSGGSSFSAWASFLGQMPTHISSRAVFNLV